MADDTTEENFNIESARGWKNSVGRIGTKREKCLMVYHPRLSIMSEFKSKYYLKKLGVDI